VYCAFHAWDLEQLTAHNLIQGRQNANLFTFPCGTAGRVCLESDLPAEGQRQKASSQDQSHQTLF